MVIQKIHRQARTAWDKNDDRLRKQNSNKRSEKRKTTKGTEAIVRFATLRFTRWEQRARLLGIAKMRCRDSEQPHGTTIRHKDNDQVSLSGAPSYGEGGGGGGGVELGGGPQGSGGGGGGGGGGNDDVASCWADTDD